MAHAVESMLFHDVRSRIQPDRVLRLDSIAIDPIPSHVWFQDQGLVDAESAQQFTIDHPDPDLP